MKRRELSSSPKIFERSHEVHNFVQVFAAQSALDEVGDLRKTSTRPIG
jgi:hypothetical protein